jgi:electron transport complex protein RnfC
MVPVEDRERRYPLIWLDRSARKSADAARERYRRRNLRLEREQQEKAGRLKARAEGSKAAGDLPTEDPKRALIAAAIERARLQKEQVQPQNVDNLSPEARATIAAIEARRTQAEQAVGDTPPEET